MAQNGAKQQAAAYGLALAAVALAAFVRLVLDPWLGNETPYVSFLVAVAFASWIGGFGPAAMATLAALALGNFLFVPPRGTLAAEGPRLFGLVMFLAGGLTIAGVGEGMRRAHARAQRAEDEMRAQGEVRLPFEAAGVGHTEIDADSGRFLRVNHTFCEMTGFAVDELLARSVLDVTHPDDRERSRAALAVLRAGADERLEIEKRYLRRDGGVFHARVTSTPVRDAAGQPRRVHASVVDVTPRWQAEEALRASEARYRSLAEGMPHIVWECDPEGNCNYLNRAWYEYTGAAPGSGLRREWLAYYDARDVESLTAAWTAALAAQGAVAYDLYARMRRHDGNSRWFRIIGAPVRSDDGRIVRWVGTCTDVHDVRELIGALQDADRRKDEFIATLAHELRNPLAPIRNAVEYLKMKGPQEPPLEAARDMIERQLAQMVRLIDDLLDVSRITRGKLALRRERVELAQVVRQAIDTSRPNIDAAHHTLDVTLPDAPVVLDADPVRLAQVLANLLNNAAKYTLPGGRIALVAQVAAGEVAIAVRDNGVGIAAGEIERVFEMFAQVGEPPGADHGGLGIGLTLVRRLVEMHGGRVEARSDGPGRGSEFVVRLPLPADAQAGLPPRVGEPTPRRVAAHRVLVVDDNRDAAVSLAMVLTLAGCATEVAHDGPAAVALARRWRPDLILLDLGLPGLDGHAVCRAIRSEPWGASVTIVAVTGWGQEEDRRRSRAAGFDGHLVKPVDHGALLALLDAFAQAREPRVSAA